MIKLKHILQELEVGDVLLGEPTATNWNPTHPLSHAARWKELGIPYEPNTIDEKQLIQLLRDWIIKMRSDPDLGELLRELLPLKSKFPIILDPTKGRSVYDGTSFYRGTLVPLKGILSLSGWAVNDSLDFPYGVIETKAPYVWNAVSRKGFTSLTPSTDIADGFAADYMGDSGMKFTDIVKRLADGSGMLPVVIRIEDTHKDVIMNPRVMNMIGGLGEYEVLLVGSQVKTKSVIVPNWKLIQKAADELGVDLTQHFKGI
jgi:hypothetical protein